MVLYHVRQKHDNPKGQTGYGGKVNKFLWKKQGIIEKNGCHKMT